MKERYYIEKLWREEKYNVLMHNQNQYIYIRETLKNQPAYQEIKHLIDEALKTELTVGNILNAYDHMWGYFKNKANIEEKKYYISLKENLKNQQIDELQLKEFMSHLAHKYQITYLIESTILQ